MYTIANTTFINIPKDKRDEFLAEAAKNLQNRAEDMEFYRDFGIDHKDMDIEDFLDQIKEHGVDTFSRLEDIAQKAEALPEFNEYGLCFDFVEAGTFDGQRCGYYRYQISTGGPGEEIRFYDGGLIEFVFLDWFTGVGFNVTYDERFNWLDKFFAEIEMMDWQSLDPEQIELVDEDDTY